jgi:fatty acid desaturase
MAVPGRLNAAIMGVAFAVALACLWAASHADHWFAVAVAAVVFSFVNNTIFSLQHEAVHRHLHSSRRLNEMGGTLCAAMFPTAFGIQRVSHLGHHRRNRTDEELYDYYLPGQSRWLKTYWIYCLLTGFYWSIIPVAGFVYVIAPWVFRTRAFQAGPARWWGFERFVQDIANERIAEVWPGAAFTLAFQTAMIALLDLTWTGWLACYWAFALNWSSLQYVDHAWSERDVHDGAWNLKVSPVTRALFLNYHYHLVHHRWPQIPWLYLPRHADPAEQGPSFWKIYLSLFGGARPAPPGPGPEPLPGAARTSR